MVLEVSQKIEWQNWAFHSHILHVRTRTCSEYCR